MARAIPLVLVAAMTMTAGGFSQPGTSSLPQFELIQPDLFAASGGQPNAWADIDGDGDLDEFVGFAAGKPNRLYRNDNGTFVEIAAAAGVADLTDTRAAAWADYDGDGRVDLYVGFTRRSETRNRLYHNISTPGSVRFTEVAAEVGVDVLGESRQLSWIDYDNDGDLDLFVAVRDAPNMLFRNDAGRFTSVGKELGVDDPRRTVGAVWFDYDGDGDLDVFTANQNGDTNGLWRNDGSRFVDVAADLGMNAPGRPETSGSNGPSVVDVDNDGDLDLFVAGYGSNFLYRNDGNGRFTEIAGQLGLAGGDKATPSRWGDFDNDGHPDLYVSSYIDQPLKERDFLFHREGARFLDVRTAVGLTLGATHGVQWVDVDGDGDLDLALANNNPNGAHPVYRNLLKKSASTRSLSIPVKDGKGHVRKPGTEVRVYAAGARRLIGMGMFDTGSGYCSQNVMPVHIGLGSFTGRVDVQVREMPLRKR